MNKKTNKSPQERAERSTAVKTTQDLIVEMMKKPALNGGFNTLMTEIHHIKEAQENMGEKIDNIHDAIYHPDDGLFSRVKDIENSKLSVKDFDQITEEVSLLKQQAKFDERASVDDEKDAEIQKKAIVDHDEKLKELTKFRERSLAVVKWCALTLVGGLLTLIGKFLYDLLRGHIKFV